MDHTSDNIWRILLLLATSDSIKLVCSSACPWSSSLSRCSSVWWSNWRRLGFIALNTIYLFVLRTLFHTMTILTTLETSSGAIRTHPWVGSTLFNTCRSLTTSLFDTILRLHRSNSEILGILILELTFVPICVRALAYMERVPFVSVGKVNHWHYSSIVRTHSLY